MHKSRGPFTEHPGKLMLKGSSNYSKDMQKAQILAFIQCALDAQKFLEWNDSFSATKMAGTCWSHVLDMTADVSQAVTSDPDAWFRADDILERLQVAQICAESTFSFGLDASVHMRLSVANRVDEAMGIKHLRVDPLKAGEDDFMSDDTYKLVQAEAEKKQNLTWAKQGDFPRSKAGSSFFGKPSQKYPRGGKSNTYQNKKQSGGRGSGRGRGRGGKGRDKGKGGRGSGNDPSGGDP